MMKIYVLPGCPYCARAIAKVDELGIKDKVEYVEVPSPHEERTALKEITKDIEGNPVGVPTMICHACDSEHVIADDDDAIIAHLEEKFGQK